MASRWPRKRKLDQELKNYIKLIQSDPTDNPADNAADSSPAKSTHSHRLSIHKMCRPGIAISSCSHINVDTDSDCCVNDDISSLSQYVYSTSEYDAASTESDSDEENVTDRMNIEAEVTLEVETSG